MYCKTVSTIYGWKTVHSHLICWKFNS